MALTEEPIIEFQHFGFQYNAQSKPTLYDISLEVRRGEKILIAGPSGCGKSTLVHCMNGLIPFSYRGEQTGTVKIAGKETREQSLFEISKEVGTVLQDTDSQFVGMTVAEDLAFAPENDCVGEPELHDRVRKVAELVHIEDCLSQAPGDLSGGQKQRVAMGGVLVEDVSVLLFDEPLANLDPATGKAAIELIDEMQKRTGAAVIIVEHRLEDVLWCPVDRVVLMGEGRILYDGPSEKLLSGSLLSENGIREPLYITAMKYAGVEIRPELRPESIRSLRLPEEDREKVRKWFRESRTDREKPGLNTLLSAKDIRFSYDGEREILKGISLEVRKGEMLAVVGTNGAGKSTFAKVICGLGTKDAAEMCGELKLNGADLGPLSIKERADHIGFVMQDPNQMISKTMIMEEVSLGLVTRNKSAEEINALTERSLKTCGLWPFRKWPVSALSFGQKKRVTIASILALDPEMVILDEPTAGQDFRHYTEIMEFLRDLRDRGISVMMITHDMHLMLEYADRCAVFHDGRVIALSTGAEILTDPELVKRASLKETSLYDLALLAGIEDPSAFVQCFIDYEREVVRA